MPRLTQELLFDAVVLLQNIAGTIPHEAKAYWSWFVSRHAHLFRGTGKETDEMIEKNMAAWDFATIRQFLRFGQVMNEHEPLPEWTKW